uniref:Secreted protein n=1 Tax=Anopheles darlingi TaxID=43151 RepID=A0A2M4DI36_ANODA
MAILKLSLLLQQAFALKMVKRLISHSIVFMALTERILNHFDKVHEMYVCGCFLILLKFIIIFKIYHPIVDL